MNDYWNKKDSLTVPLFLFRKQNHRIRCNHGIQQLPYTALLGTYNMMMTMNNYFLYYKNTRYHKIRSEDIGIHAHHDIQTQKATEDYLC